MSHLGHLEAGRRHDLRVGISPDAPDESELHEEADGAFGYAYSYETSSRYDGPGLRVVLFVSGCLLRCSYCHNPDTWHIKGRHVCLSATGDRPAGDIRPRLTIARRRPDHFRWRTDGPARVYPAHIGRSQTARSAYRDRNLGYLGDQFDDSISWPWTSCCSTSKARIPRRTQSNWAPTGAYAPLCERLVALLKSRLGCVFTGAGLTDDPANVDGIARFVAPMKMSSGWRCSPSINSVHLNGKQWAWITNAITPQPRRPPSSTALSNNSAPRVAKPADQLPTAKPRNQSCLILPGKSSAHSPS